MNLRLIHIKNELKIQKEYEDRKIKELIQEYKINKIYDYNPSIHNTEFKIHDQEIEYRVSEIMRLNESYTTHKNELDREQQYRRYIINSTYGIDPADQNAMIKTYYETIRSLDD